MQIQKIKIELLMVAEYNPRVMSEEELENLKESVKSFDMVEPIIVNKDMTVIGGHQRLKVAKDLGWTEVPCIIVDLDKRREKILNLALNKIVGSWDEEKLTALVREMKDYPEIKLSGFDDYELEMLNVQYDLSYNNEEIKSDEELKELFARNERVEITVEKPEISVKKKKVAFYVETFEQYKLIKETFKTNREAELDIKKLIELIKK